MKQETQVVFEQAKGAWTDIAEDDLTQQRRGPGGNGEHCAPSFKVFRIVEDIATRGAEHDYQDVLELGVQGVLAMYSLSSYLTKDEERLMRESLLEMGEQRQTSEMARFEVSCKDELLLGLRDRSWMKPADLEREHKIDRAAWRKLSTEPKKLLVTRIAEPGDAGKPLLPGRETSVERMPANAAAAADAHRTEGREDTQVLPEPQLVTVECSS